MGSSFRQVSTRHRKKGAALKLPSSLPPPPPIINIDVRDTGKPKKRSVTKLWWTRFDWTGAMENSTSCDKNTIIKRTSLTARDLRTAFSNSSKILAREKAIVINLEVIKGIITAEEVLLLYPLRPEVLSLTGRLKQFFPLKNGQENVQSSLVIEDGEGLESELPFEFQVLEIALDVVCSFIDSNVAALETQAWPLLDEITKKVSTKNLKNLRSFKSNLTCLLARVQKVRDEIEHFLDDKEDMADLYLTRKWIKKYQTEPLLGDVASGSSNLHHYSSIVTEEDNVDDLEMLLEAYFMQLEGMRNKILMMKEHIDNTEGYVKILQNSRRNGMIGQKLRIEVANFALATGTLVVNLFGMNIPIPLYNTPGVFNNLVLGVVALTMLLFMAILGYFKWMKLLD